MESVHVRIEEFLNKYPLISMQDMLAHELSDPSFQDPIWKLMQKKEGHFPFSNQLIQLFLYVRNLNKNLFQFIEGKQSCQQKSWDAQVQHPDKELYGGGVMTIIREDILE